MPEAEEAKEDWPNPGLLGSGHVQLEGTAGAQWPWLPVAAPALRDCKLGLEDPTLHAEPTPTNRTGHEGTGLMVQKQPDISIGQSSPALSRGALPGHGPLDTARPPTHRVTTEDSG